MYCTVGSVLPVAVVSGLVNSVQTYCGLEIAIMTMRPNTSCSQRCWDRGAGVCMNFFSATDGGKGLGHEQVPFRIRHRKVT